MKHITIFGSYGKGAIGDSIILIGLINKINELYKEEVTITVLTVELININLELKKLGLNFTVNEENIHIKHEKYPKKILYLAKVIINKVHHSFPYDKKTIVRILRETDHLLIGGGNLIMDYYSEWPKNLLYICNLAHAQKVPYSFIGVGAGPIQTRDGKDVLKKCLSGARHILLRDIQSEIILQGCLKYFQSEVTTDLGFGISKQIINKTKKNILLVNLADYYGETWPEKNPVRNRLYINAMIELTVNICNHFKINEIEIFITNKNDDNISYAFSKKLKTDHINLTVHNCFHDKNIYISDLISLASRAKYLLSTRLHAAILGTVSGCIIIPVSYQLKVKSIITEKNISNEVIDINDLLENKLSFNTLITKNIKSPEINLLNQHKIIENSIKKILD